MTSERQQLQEIVSEFRGLISSLRSQAMARHTMDAVSTDERLAAEFADKVNEIGKRLRSRGDCRPSLSTRQVTDAKREALSPEADCEGYATAMRTFHRR